MVRLSPLLVVANSSLESSASLSKDTPEDSSADRYPPLDPKLDSPFSEEACIPSTPG